MNYKIVLLKLQILLKNVIQRVINVKRITK